MSLYLFLSTTTIIVKDPLQETLLLNSKLINKSWVNYFAKIVSSVAMHNGFITTDIGIMGIIVKHKVKSLKTGIWFMKQAYFCWWNKQFPIIQASSREKINVLLHHKTFKYLSWTYCLALCSFILKCSSNFTFLDGCHLKFVENFINKSSLLWIHWTNRLKCLLGNLVFSRPLKNWVNNWFLCYCVNVEKV